MKKHLYPELSRRHFIQASLAAGVSLSSAGRLFAATTGTLPLIEKTIPSTGESIPVMGIGTNSFREDNYDDLKAILQRMHEMGGTVIDTAESYGESEGVIGRILTELNIRDDMFISTKFNAEGKGWGRGLSGAASFEQSLQRLQTDYVDLLEVHRVAGLDDLMPVMQEYKQAGKIRYLGVTTFRNDEHDQMIAAMEKYPLDFIQIDCSIANRNAAERVFPIAMERKVAVMINVPLGGRRGSLFNDVSGKELPDWAADFDASSWSQFFLKYVASHAAVSCVIPGSTQMKHLEDNQGAGLGRLPNEEQRLRMEQYWDSISS